MDLNIVYHNLGMPYGMPLSDADWTTYFKLKGVSITPRSADMVLRHPILISHRSPQCSYRTREGLEHVSKDWVNSERNRTHHQKPAKSRDGRFLKNQFVAHDRIPRVHDSDATQV